MIVFTLIGMAAVALLSVLGISVVIEGVNKVKL